MMRTNPWRQAAACLFALLAGCRPGEPARVEAPPETPPDTAAGETAFGWAGASKAAMLVPVYINGQGPFDLVLDTGATYTCLDDSLAERLDLPEQRGSIGIGTTVQGRGRVRLVRIDSLRVGGATTSDTPACVLDFPRAGAKGIEIQGLLGLNFLRSFRVTLDFQRDIIRLQPTHSE